MEMENMPIPKRPETEEDKENLRQIWQDTKAEDIAEFIGSLEDREDQLAYIGALEPEDMAIVLNELGDGELFTELLLNMSEEEARLITDEISTDDATDLLADIDESTQKRVLSLFEDESRDDITDLLTYEEDTAGGLMTTEFVVVPVFVEVEKAIELIRSFAPDAETIYYIYVIDGSNRLVGILSLRELIVAHPNSTVAEIMIPDVLSVNVHADQEEVADLMSKYNLLALPVVDDEEHILGIITVDDIVDVIHEEATEDIYRMAGTSEREGEEDSTVFNAYRARMPWLLITILGELGSGSVLSASEVKLQTVAALSIFIPLLTGLAGNVGTQSSTVTVRGIATGSITPKTAIRTIAKEVIVGLILGLTIGLLVMGIATFWKDNFQIGLVVGITLFINNFTAALMGTVVPLIFMLVKKDPAVASAPFITMVVDILGLVNYMLVATVILGL